jgi:hypothetical protein
VFELIDSGFDPKKLDSVLVEAKKQKLTKKEQREKLLIDSVLSFKYHKKSRFGYSKSAF